MVYTDKPYDIDTPYKRQIQREKNIYIYLCLFIAFLFLIRAFDVIYYHLQAPFDLVYESPNLSTIQCIKDKRNPYAPDTYASFPFIFTVYTPLYHYIVSQFPIMKGNPFFWGRIVSMTAMFLSAFALLFINKKNKIQFLPIIGIGVYFSFWPVISNTAFLKNDSTALMFSVYAVVLTSRSRSTFGVILAALFSVCALASKQSYLAAIAACSLYFLLSDRRKFLIFTAFVSFFAGIFILLTVFVWGSSGFWFCTVNALGQEINFQHGISNIKHMLSQPMLCFLIGLTVSFSYFLYKWKRWTYFVDSPYFIYLLTSQGLLMATIGKIGSSTNYFIEFFLSLMIWLIYSVEKFDPMTFKKPFFMFLTSAFVLFSFIEVGFSDHKNFTFANKELIQQKMCYYKEMKRVVDSLGIENPKILDPLTFSHIYQISDHLYFNDPYLYFLLWKDGTMDYSILTNAINSYSFDIIMLPINIKYDDIRGPLKAISDEIQRYYKIGAQGCGYYFYIQPSDDGANETYDQTYL